MFSFGGGGFPFPGMDGVGGMGGGRRPSKDVDTTKFYKLLGVDKNASKAEIKKAYHKMAMEHHPDKGGDTEKFKEIRRAFEVLSDSEKRAKYDRFGEDSLDEPQARDPFDPFFPGRPKRKSTKDVVQPLTVTLEQLYNGQTKKMAITRKVIDKRSGVQECSDCGGRGVRVQVIRMGSIIQQMQSACHACGGQGKSFKTKQDREVLEVHIQKGSPDNHKVTFREMADEHPDMDTGDVHFVIKQQEHEIFKRRGADLFIEREISLVEALCGFEMEITHLDGRKLLIKTQPGEIVKPMARGFDPIADTENKMEWEVIENADCPSIDSVAQADETDPDTLKKACETQLKRNGIDVGCFVIDGQGAHFKQAKREEALAAKKTKKGTTMYVLADPNAKAHLRMMKAVKDEGMPTFKNPFIHGNLFLILTIKFPDSLTPEAQNDIAKLLPAPMNKSSVSEGDEGVEVHTLTDIDPLTSYKANKVNMQAGGEAYDEHEDEGSRGGGAQCQQM